MLHFITFCMLSVWFYFLWIFARMSGPHARFIEYSGWRSELKWLMCVSHVRQTKTINYLSQANHFLIAQTFCHSAALHTKNWIWNKQKRVKIWNEQKDEIFHQKIQIFNSVINKLHCNWIIIALIMMRLKSFYI